MQELTYDVVDGDGTKLVLTARQISSIAGIPVANVRSRLQRGMRDMPSLTAAVREYGLGPREMTEAQRVKREAERLRRRQRYEVYYAQLTEDRAASAKAGIEKQRASVAVDPFGEHLDELDWDTCSEDERRAIAERHRRKRTALGLPVQEMYLKYLGETPAGYARNEAARKASLHEQALANALRRDSGEE